jgi:hypothetical protein
MIIQAIDLDCALHCSRNMLPAAVAAGTESTRIARSLRGGSIRLSNRVKHRIVAGPAANKDYPRCAPQ